MTRQELLDTMSKDKRVKSIEYSKRYFHIWLNEGYYFYNMGDGRLTAVSFWELNTIDQVKDKMKGVYHIVSNFDRSEEIIHGIRELKSDIKWRGKAIEEYEEKIERLKFLVKQDETKLQTITQELENYIGSEE